MDFTEPYRHSSADCLAFSPGSSFFASISGSSSRTLVIRASSTLQVIRSWDFDETIDTVRWYCDGSFVIAASTEAGVAYVLQTDPEALMHRPKEDEIDVMARIVAGAEGLVAVTWAPRDACVLNFSSEQLRMTITRLLDSSVTLVQHPKRARIFTTPKFPSQFALLERHSSKDVISLYTPNRSSGSSKPAFTIERSFQAATNDAELLSWSNDGRYIAVWDNALEYKLLVYTPFGHLRATFTIDPAGPTEPSTLTSAAAVIKSSTSGANFKSSIASGDRRGKEDDEPKVSGGGLGIRVVEWRPDTSLLAIGGYDDKIRLLDNEEWSELYVLDHTKPTINASSAPADILPYGPLMAWREPSGFIEATGGRGIAPYAISTLPVSPPMVRPDHSQPRPSQGISWLSWNPDGTLLASLSNSLPSTLFIHAFPAQPRDQLDGTAPKPYLLAILQQLSPIKCARWKPDHPGKLALCCATGAVYLWTLLATPSASSTPSAIAEAHDNSSFVSHVSAREEDPGRATLQQIAEAVPIPTEHFRATSIRWSPDGHKLLISGPQTFCLAIEADSDMDEDVSMGSNA